MITSCVGGCHRGVRCPLASSPVNRRLKASRGRLQLRASHAVEEKSDAEITAEKYGLEAGLLKVMTAKGNTVEVQESKTEQAKRLLAQYGSAYLITSISCAALSFAACYALVDSGVDVASLLSNVGLTVQAGSTEEQVGAFALAYAAHKALSPVRFPPTVALTPMVAKWLGKGPDTEGSEQ